MNNYSFLSSTPVSEPLPMMNPSAMQPRPPPSPSPSNPGSQFNGNGAQQNGIPMVNGLPSGGQQTDMNHLWAVVQQLSQVLEENKQQTAGIVNGVNAVRARALDDGISGGMNGGGVGVRELNGEIESATSRHQELTTLQSQLSSLQNTNTSLTTSNTQFQGLITDYENALTLLLDKLRPYAYNQTSSILALHKHYQKLLEEERGVSMQLRLEHAEWQAGLGRVADYARGAMKAQGESEEELRRQLREAREENRVLRGLAGWEVKDGEDDSL